MTVTTQQAKVRRSTGARPWVADEELLKRSSEANDCQAFEQIFNRYYAILCEQAYRLVRCEHCSKEIVSDVFMKIWRNRGCLSINTKVRYYLRTAVRNQSIDYLRANVKEQRRKSQLDRDFDSGYSMPDEIVIGSEFRKKVEVAVESLPPQGKQVFRLSRDEGLKYREIASLLGISIKTVETHMRRSLIHLRKALL